MPRSTFVYREGVGVVDKRVAAPLVSRLPRARGICLPGLIRDGMEPVRHPCTGALMDSKRAFREVTRAHGCEEIGDQSPVVAPSYVEERAYSDGLKRDIAQAMDAAEHRPAESAAAVFGAMGAAVPEPAAADGWV